MALIKCSECGKDISTNAKACPHCGAKPPYRPSLAFILIAGLLVVFGVKASLESSRPPPEELPKTDEQIAPIPVRPIDETAMKKASAIHSDNFCPALGKALRGKDAEFARAMIKLAADNHYSDLQIPEQQAIKDRSIKLGMTTCMVWAAIGLPKDVNSSVGAYGTKSQWVYPDSYVYFEDGILTSWQN